MIIQKKCVCGKVFKTHDYRIKDGRGKFCNIRCKYKYAVRPSGLKYNIKVINPTWFKKNKGYGVDKKGYAVVHIGSNHYQRQHRLVMERYLGRKLKVYEVVHHKDRNKLNNNIDNLVLMTKKEHDKLHNGRK